MRFRLAVVPLLLVSLLASAAVACGDDDDDDNDDQAATAPAAGHVTVTISDNRFSPAEATVGVNNAVIWEWSGNNQHSVVGTFDGEDVESPRLTGTGTFVQSFGQAGTFEYQCGVHGASMSGTVIIE